MKLMLALVLLSLFAGAQVTTQIQIPGVQTTATPPPSDSPPAPAAGGAGSGASAGSAATKKGGLNTNIYEKDSTSRSFTAKVKVIREFQGQWEVMFEGVTGFYTVSGDHQAILVEAEKTKSRVIVKVDDENRRVISAMLGGGGAGAGAGSAPGR